MVATPNFKRAFITVTRNQTDVNQAMLVCALERYRHKHGEYPSSLDALVPDSLSKPPLDITTGEPLEISHRTDDGKFLLYSVGWNEADDGGNRKASLGEAAVVGERLAEVADARR